jgi:hypothetical protein
MTRPATTKTWVTLAPDAEKEERREEGGERTKNGVEQSDVSTQSTRLLNQYKIGVRCNCKHHMFHDKLKQLQLNVEKGVRTLDTQ